MRLATLLLSVLLLPQLAAAQGGAPAGAPPGAAPPDASRTAPPTAPPPAARAAATALPAASPDSPRVRVVTNAGNFLIELDKLRAPLTVDAFMKYVKEGFYSGVIFHRVVAGFIAQAGGYTADMMPKAVTQNVHNESGNGLSNLRATVGFARSNDPHSGTSQFYINLADNIDLNPRPTRWGYTVFGKVIEGMEVVDDIGHRPTAGGGPFDRNVPVEPIIIERIEVVE